MHYSGCGGLRGFSRLYEKKMLRLRELQEKSTYGAEHIAVIRSLARVIFRAFHNALLHARYTDLNGFAFRLCKDNIFGVEN